MLRTFGLSGNSFLVAMVSVVNEMFYISFVEFIKNLSTHALHEYECINKKINSKEGV